MTTYNIKSFIWAHISAVRYERAHPDLATFYPGLYRALCRAFGFDVQQLPEGLSCAFQDAVAIILKTHGALEYMEVPELVGPLIERHSGKIGDAVDALKQAHFALLLDIVEGVHGPCSKVVTSEELLALGFDDSAPPDPIDYW